MGNPYALCQALVAEFEQGRALLSVGRAASEPSAAVAGQNGQANIVSREEEQTKLLHEVENLDM